MLKVLVSKCAVLIAVILLVANPSSAQTSIKPKYNNSTLYTGIEVGSKGVKLSVIEVGKSAKKNNGGFIILKDTSINTDFISFTPATFSATLNGLCDLYNKAVNEYKIPSKRVFTVISSGVKMQAGKEEKHIWITNLIDSFRLKIKEPQRLVEVVDVSDEAKLSHLGIVPASRRYSTFLVDIGSGNTKGGFFPFGNDKDFRLFQLNWGTKSTTNATEKRLDTDKSLANYHKELTRVLGGAESSEISYAVNVSGAYPLSDNIAISGGIAWAVATLTHPEMLDNPIVSVTYDEVVKFSEKLYKNFSALSPNMLIDKMDETNKATAIKEITRVQQVFDQRSLMAGTGLLLKIMRQFSTAFETKAFYLIKNGQVGWVSAYVDEELEDK
jgi:hypothetical protein